MVKDEIEATNKRIAVVFWVRLVVLALLTANGLYFDRWGGVIFFVAVMVIELMRKVDQFFVVMIALLALLKTLKGERNDA